MSYYKAIIISVWISIIGSIVIIIIAVSWGSGGLMLNLLAIGLFLLYTNWQGRRYIQYQFMRFLLNRRNRMDERVDSGTIAEPIAVSLHSQITDIMYLFKKEKYHLIYVINEHGRLHGVVTEERVMHTYLLENKHGSAVSELFL
jgi:stage IV sporulation protein FB